MMTMYAPIAFGPLPLLAFQRAQDGHLQLVASGVPAVSSSMQLHNLRVLSLKPDIEGGSQGGFPSIRKPESLGCLGGHFMPTAGCPLSLSTQECA